MLRQKQRATYGHHGTSLGKSARRSPHTVSALQQESEESKRKKLKESRLASSHRPGDKRRHMERSEKREQTAPKHKKPQHKDPGPAPKKRTLKKDPELEARLRASGPGDRAEYERGMAESRARYKTMPEKQYSPEEEARFAARKAEYSLDKYAQPSAEQLAEHKRKEELHQQEQQERAKKQEKFEEHGKRHIDPAGFKAPERMASPPQVPDSRIGPAKGHEARMAQIMRTKDLTSAVPEQPQEQKQEPPAKRQKQPPRNLDAMAQGQQAAAPVPAQAIVVDPSEVQQMHKPHQAKWAAKAGKPLAAEAITISHAPGTASVITGLFPQV